MLSLIKGSHKYFKRLIAQSGTINLTRSPEEAIECTDKLMEALGCSTVADLLKIDGDTLLQAAEVNFAKQFPERDGKYLPADTWQALAEGAASDIEMLIGCNKDEMDFFVSSFGLEKWYAWAAERKDFSYAKPDWWK